MTGTNAAGGSGPRHPGTNLAHMGDYNQSVVLDAVRRAPDGVSRVELQQQTGLAAQTVSNIVRRLLDTGMVVESGKQARSTGKPRTIVTLDPDGGYAVGVHLDPAVITCVLLDLTGRVRTRAAMPTPLDNDPHRIISLVADQIEQLIMNSDVDGGRIAGIGIATPGPIDQDENLVVDPPLLFGWHRVPFRKILADLTGLPVEADKDTTAAAVGEMWSGIGHTVDDFLFFYVGTGFGVGMVHGGEVMRGSSGNAGEIGHIIADPDGPPCDCGLRGCLSAACMPSNLVREAETAGVIADDRVSRGGLAISESFGRLCDAADSGDERAVAIVDRAADRVGRGTSVITNLLDINRVVFGGPYWPRLADRFLARVPAIIGEQSIGNTFRAPQVGGTELGADVGAIGAACLVLNRRLGVRSARLRIGP